MNTKFKSVLIMILLLVTSYATSQTGSDPLGAGIERAGRNLSSSIPAIRNFLYILAAIVGSYGAVKVFGKFQNQDQDTTKAMGQYGLGFIFLLTAGYIIDATFL